jgi:hypothetical protein
VRGAIWNAAACTKTTRFIKAEMKRAGVTYAELARRLEEHGLKETEASIANKLRVHSESDQQRPSLRSRSMAEAA